MSLIPPDSAGTPGVAELICTPSFQLVNRTRQEVLRRRLSATEDQNVVTLVHQRFSMPDADLYHLRGTFCGIHEDNRSVSVMSGQVDRQ